MPTDRQSSDHPRLGVGVLVFRDDRFLLVERGQEPNRGVWTLPGGKVEWGESVLEAAKRELWEECRLKAESYIFLDYFEFLDREAYSLRFHYVVLDFMAEYREGQLTPGSDVRAAAWCCFDDLQRLKTTDATRAMVHRALRYRADR
jgi:ADP-ribose pyrophosphatase YjhB (NUDIX family)